MRCGNHSLTYVVGGGADVHVILYLSCAVLVSPLNRNVNKSNSNIKLGASAFHFDSKISA